MRDIEKMCIQLEIDSAQFWAQYRDSTGRIAEYGFTEGQDFYSELSKTPNGGRPSREYHLSLDMAKELSMVERNEVGAPCGEWLG